MPLRSVEAATRDDANAAAREQFGPQTRVVGVRRVRSGGVLGFFATERYVAEVAPDQAVRPPVRATTEPDDEAPADFSSPLASAAPARARASAPARNGAAAWAAEAVRSTDVDEARVSELAGLLTAQPAEPETFSSSRGPYPRASFPRAGSTASPASPVGADDEARPPVHVADQHALPAEPAAPSPFTAALARMVAGDRDVRQAVREALQDPANRPDGDAEAWPMSPAPLGAADAPVPPSAARQKEDPVENQVITPPSMSTTPSVAGPDRAAEPEAAPAPDSSREEAIAEILRAALAQGHSDDALAGILRKLLAGASPEVALPEPAAVETAVAEPAVVPPPVLDLPERLAPAPPLVTGSASAPAPTPRVFFESMWGEFSPQATLWAEASGAVPPVAAPARAAAAPLDPEVRTDAPIWAEIVQPEPAAEAAALEFAPVEAPVVEAVADIGPVVETPVVETPAESAPAVEAETPVAEERLEEAEVAEEAPALARTASDPAPMMSLDSTTVMPPLSLLPPLPSSRGRGRGRPPVPPTTSRRSARPVAPDATPVDVTAAVATALEHPVQAPEEAPAPAVGTTPTDATEGLPRTAIPVTGSLATVTRLPVGPHPVTPDTTEQPDADGADEEPPAAPVLASGDIAGRLVTLGLPEALLGATFADEVAAHGTYAALTRALAARLPQPPELPTGAGEVIFVVGPGVETLRAARSLATSLRLDSDRVPWATRGDLAGLAPESSRMTTVEAAIDRRQDASHAGTVTVVAVHAPLRTDAYWMTQMMAIWAPTAVWALVEATRKPEDLEPWIDGLPQVDAVIVEDTDLSSDPAAVLRRLAAPVGLLDGVRATPHRWASLLCERLETRQA